MTPKVRAGGYIGGHDYCAEWPGVIQAVDEVFGKPDLLFDDHSLIVERRQQDD